MHKGNILIGGALLFGMLTAEINAICVTKSCDPTLTYALAKEGKALNDRLDDLFGAIKATIEDTRITNDLLVRDTFELMRTRQRYRIRLRDALEQSKHAKNLSDIISAGGSLHAIQAQISIEKINTEKKASK